MKRLYRPDAYPERIFPVLGETAKLALRIPAGGEKRRKLLVLIAAYGDAGQHRPNDWQLIERLPFLAKMPRRSAGKRLEQLVKALERDGLISRHGRMKGRYETHLHSDAPTQAAET